MSARVVPPACEWCGEDYDTDASPCTHLDLCPACADDCGTCRRQDDDARYDLDRELRDEAAMVARDVREGL